MGNVSTQGLLRRRTQSTTNTIQLVAATLADLVVREHLSVWVASIVTESRIGGLDFRSEYLFLSGRNYGQPVQGSLERRVLEPVADWSTHLKKHFGFNGNVGPNAYMLFYLMFDKPVKKPVHDLMQIATQDASHVSAHAIEQAQQWYRQVKQTHPGFIDEVERQIRQALKARTYEEPTTG